MTVSNMAGSTAAVVFPDHGHQVLSVLVHLLGCSVLAACFARRYSISNMNIAKFCVLAIFVDSWLFVFSAGVVVNGVGTSLNPAACLSGIYLCIFFYASSKVLIYLFLAEKVHIVWSAGQPISRFKSKVWLVCFVVLFGYVAIFILMIVAKIAYITDDRTCIIGLKSIASIPLLAYDIWLTSFLTFMFVWPLLRRNLSTGNLRALAVRTCWAAGVALATSVVNIAILTSLHGQQLGWVCLASCGFDVTINAIVIFAVSHRTDGPTHLEADSPRAPISSEKLVSDRSSPRTPRSPRVAMFKNKTENSRPALDHSFAYSRDFALSKADDSVMTITGLNSTSYTADMYDYLPKDQISEMESQSKGLTPLTERSLSSLQTNRNSASFDDHHTLSAHDVTVTKVFEGPEHRRGSSRGFIADFCDRFGKGHNEVNNIAIEVTVTTETQPNNNSQPALNVTSEENVVQPPSSSPQPHAL